MIVPERKFVQVQRQVILAHLVVTAHNSALEQAPEPFNRVRMRRADNVLALTVIDRLVDETMRAKMPVSGVFIGRHQRDFLRDSLFYKAFQRVESGLFDHLADDVSLAADGSDHHCLAGAVWPATVTALVPMLIRVFSADETFIRFYFTDQLVKRLVLHRGANARAHIPSGFVAAASDLPVNL